MLATGINRVAIQSQCWYRFSRRYTNGYLQSPEGYEFRLDSFKHPNKDWHEQRRNKLTASTFGGAIGIWPRRRVQLWQEKIRGIPPFLLSEFNIAVAFNNIKEKQAMRDYATWTNNCVCIPEFKVHDNPADSWLGASPDGLVELQSGGGVLEIKIPYSKGDQKAIFPWKRIPRFYMPQAQGLLEIMNRDWMHLYVWTPFNGSNLFRVDRDREYWALLKEALSDFWWKHVEPVMVMCHSGTITNPLVELRPLVPEPRHDQCTELYYRSNRLVDRNSELIHCYPPVSGFHNRRRDFVSSY